MTFWSTFYDVRGKVGNRPWSLELRQKSFVLKLVNAVIVGISSVVGGERWSKKKVLKLHKSSHGDQRSSTFHLNAGELSWNVLLTLHAFGYHSQSLGRVDYIQLMQPKSLMCAEILRRDF